ncbi:hypothetical protein AMTRI_Chr11g150880 [Amborella trichopoda]|uniref:Uncharacterized protein n=1 Tax=Amborella trichopoda TaxID=13333 RepID=W1PSP2_AMBTC|nr:hypothetical protein AMTR_s00040p00128790 [Amborella trichopoda]
MAPQKRKQAVACFKFGKSKSSEKTVPKDVTVTERTIGKLGSHRNTAAIMVIFLLEIVSLGKGVTKVVSRASIWQKEEVRYLKESSIWGRSFDYVTAILARSVFNVFSRIRVIRLVFSIETEWKRSSPLPRSFSATVYPTSENPNYSKPSMVKSGPLNPK